MDDKNTTFWFARLVDATGKHMATETIWVEPGTAPAALIPDLCGFFGADENGAYDEEDIAAGSIQLFGPFVVGDALTFKATIGDDIGDEWVGVQQ